VPTPQAAGTPLYILTQVGETVDVVAPSMAYKVLGLVEMITGATTDDTTIVVTAILESAEKIPCALAGAAQTNSARRHARLARSAAQQLFHIGHIPGGHTA
jgi:hypothetical protein